MSVMRQERPQEFSPQEVVTADPGECPFCPGRESRTTPEILATGRPSGAAANGPPWRVRVFPNMYPALVKKNEIKNSGVGGRPEAISAPEEGGSASGILLQQEGSGSHEVIVCSPDHEATLATLEAGLLAEVFAVVRDRMIQLASDRSHRYVLPFFNQGAAAGATLAHPHGQIIATPLVPTVVQIKNARQADHLHSQGRCLLCDLLDREREAGSRLVTENRDWVALTPWASRFPYEMMVLPRRHQGSMIETREEEFATLGVLLQEILSRLDGLVSGLALNLVVHVSPLVCAAAAEGQVAEDGFHWHLEILPRLARLAGFEAGTGFAINSLWPEEAARRLRKEGTAH